MAVAKCDIANWPAWRVDRLPQGKCRPLSNRRPPTCGRRWLLPRAELREPASIAQKPSSNGRRLPNLPWRMRLLLRRVPPRRKARDNTGRLSKVRQRSGSYPPQPAERWQECVPRREKATPSAGMHRRKNENPVYLPHESATPTSRQRAGDIRRRLIEALVRYNERERCAQRGAQRQICGWRVSLYPWTDSARVWDGEALLFAYARQASRTVVPVWKV